jgi:hypothetical protein
VVSFTPRPLYPRGKSPPYPLESRLNGPQSRSRRHGEMKILDPTGTRTPTPRVVQPVASHYTDCAILALIHQVVGSYNPRLQSYRQGSLNSEYCQPLRPANSEPHRLPSLCDRLELNSVVPVTSTTHPQVFNTDNKNGCKKEYRLLQCDAMQSGRSKQA